MSDTTQIPGAEQMKKLFDEQSARMTQMFEEMNKTHAKWVEYGNSQLAEMNSLLKNQFNYANELAAGWAKLSTETAKKTAESFKA